MESGRSESVKPIVRHEEEGNGLEDERYGASSKTTNGLLSTQDGIEAAQRAVRNTLNPELEARLKHATGRVAGDPRPANDAVAKATGQRPTAQPSVSRDNVQSQ
jgi:hypothetical protein